MTAHRVFGPAAGLSRQYTPAELPSLIRGVRATATNGEEVVSSATFVPMPWAGSANATDASADLAVWRVPDSAVTNHRYTLSLAGTPTLIRGERIYLSADVDSGTRRLHNAVFDELTPTVLRYQIYTRLNLDHAAGAPVLDRHGQVIGIHVGTTPRQDGLYGDANPAAAILAALARAG